MFYLNLFFQSIKRHYVWGSLFLVLTFTLTLVGMNFSLFKKSVFQNGHNFNSGPYFHALIAGEENHQRISRKLLDLPGVNKVEIMEKTEIQKQVSSVLANVEMDIKEEDFSLNYVGLKIILASGLQKRSHSLIRDYLVRLVGESKVTLGGVKEISRTEKLKTQLFLKFKEWGVSVVSIGFVIIWGLVAFVFSLSVKQSSYLIEQFQRRKMVGFKTMLSGVILLTSFSLLLTMTVGQLSVVGLIISIVLLAASSALQVGKLQWQE